jgi:hypothetical protein
MQSPNFNYEQFVDQNLFNAAMLLIQSSMQELGANEVFFSPGIISGSSVTFAYNGSLQVTVTAAFPVKCLFGTGLITGAHGITAGVDSPTYNVDFTSLIPGSGSVTAYIVASSGIVQEGPFPVIGAPSGHPDFSPAFLPYLGYTTNQYTLNIVATTTEPDNITNIEIARTTLTAGQGIISSVNTTFQVPAALIIPPVSVVLGGDVVGNYNNNVVTRLQGRPMVSTAPTTNSVLAWNGSAWAPSTVVIPTTLPPNGPAGGDLYGNYPNPGVLQCSAPTFTVDNKLVVGSTSTFNDEVLGQRDIIAAGHMAAQNAAILGQALMLGQFFGALNSNNGTFVAPILNSNTGVVVNFTVQWGAFPVASIGTYNIPLNPTYTNACLWAGLSFSAPGSNGHNALLNSTSTSNINFTWLHYSSGNDTGVIYWLAIGY